MDGNKPRDKISYTEPTGKFNQHHEEAELVNGEGSSIIDPKGFQIHREYFDVKEMEIQIDEPELLDSYTSEAQFQAESLPANRSVLPPGSRW